MTREELEHIIRASAEVPQEYEANLIEGALGEALAVS